MNLKMVLRYLYKNRWFTFIKVLGLSVSICIAIVVFLTVSHEFSFDKHHKDPAQIFRVVSHFGTEPDTRYVPGVPLPLPGAISEEVTGVQEVVPLFTMLNTRISIPGAGQLKVFKNQSHVVYAGPEYFSMFHYQWIKGDPETALSKPYQVVLTRAAAHQYFPQQEPGMLIGKQLILRDSILTTVAGIVDDPEFNTDLNFRVFFSIATARTARLRHSLYSNWMATILPSQVFIKIAKGISPATIEQRLKAVYNKHFPHDKVDIKTVSPYRLQPLREIHFDPRFPPYFGNPQADKQTLYGLIIIALFLLVLGCINFINLSTAQASQRIKEIGIRKSLGGSKKHLFVQFLSEAFVITCIAIVVAVCCVPLVIDLYRDYIPAAINPMMIFTPFVPLFLFILFIAVGFLSGSYYAWTVSRIPVTKVLKGKDFGRAGGAALWVRKGLILFQFVISQFFVMATVFVGMQLNFTVNKERGFREEAVVYFETDNSDTVGTKKLVLLHKLKLIPGITKISLSNGPAAADGIWTGKVKYAMPGKETLTEVQQKYADSNFLSLFEIPLLAGRNLRDQVPMNECIINEEYSAVLGFEKPEKAIGKALLFLDKSIPIVGVVANFHQQSLHTPIKPLMILYDPRNQRIFNIALSSKKKEDTDVNRGAVLVEIAKAYKEVYPETDFDYEFQNDTIARHYASERQVSFLLKTFTGLTILISCMGLLGLTVYATNRRKKEIGIRKVMGASVAHIVRLFSFEYLTLICLAFVIAVPITYRFVHEWLNNFSYRIPISWWVFGLAGLISLVIALLTVSSQSIKAALANPADVLKSD
jgi:ABC-type antimicrobial peptide transport system permease subunit